MNVTLRQLRAFCRRRPARWLHPAGAASLRLTQSALSVLVGELERELGIRLFDRTTRVVRLTDAGREFHGSAERMLLNLEHAAATHAGWPTPIPLRLCKGPFDRV